MHSITHILILAAVLIENGFTTERTLNNELEKLIPMVLLPNAISLLIGSRKSAHFLKENDGTISYIEFPVEELKKVKSKNSISYFTSYSSDESPIFTGLSDIPTFIENNQEIIDGSKGDWGMCIMMHLMQDTISNLFWQNDICYFSMINENLVRYRLTGGKATVSEFLNIQSNLNGYFDKMLFKRIYEVYGLDFNTGMFVNLIKSAVSEVYSPEMAKCIFADLNSNKKETYESISEIKKLNIIPSLKLEDVVGTLYNELYDISNRTYKLNNRINK